MPLYLLARCVSCNLHVPLSSRPMPIHARPLFPHPSTSTHHTPHTAVTRCWHMLLLLLHAALLHTTACLDGRVDSVTHRPGSATCCTQHPPTVRPLSRPSICGLVLDPVLRACLLAIQQHTPMPCARGGRRQTWFDSSTSHAPTAWVTAFPSRTAACVPTGRAVASRLQVALFRYALLLHLHLTLHCTLYFHRPSYQSRRKLPAACSERLR